MSALFGLSKETIEETKRAASGKYAKLENKGDTMRVVFLGRNLDGTKTWPAGAYNPEPKTEAMSSINVYLVDHDQVKVWQVKTRYMRDVVTRVVKLGQQKVYDLERTGVSKATAYSVNVVDTVNEDLVNKITKHSLHDLTQTLDRPGAGVSAEDFADEDFNS